MYTHDGHVLISFLPYFRSHVRPCHAKLVWRVYYLCLFFLVSFWIVTLQRKPMEKTAETIAWPTEVVISYYGAGENIALANSIRRRSHGAGYRLFIPCFFFLQLNNLLIYFTVTSVSTVNRWCIRIKNVFTSIQWANSPLFRWNMWLFRNVVIKLKTRIYINN